MSIGGSKSSNKGSSTSTGTTNYSQTPTNPNWVTNAAPALYSAAQTLASANPQSYVAGPNALQTQAATGASALTGAPSAYQTAEGITSNTFGRPAAQTSGVTADGYVSNYLNPYLSNVADATKADMNAQNAQTNAQQQLDLAKSGALGGSGSALAIGQTLGQQSRALGTTLGNLYSSGYTDAESNAQQDAARQQSANDLNAQLKQQNRQMILGAAGQLGTLAGQQQDTARQNVVAQDAAGAPLQQIAQTQAQAPLDLQSWLNQYFSSEPLNLFQGQTGTSTTNQSGTSKGSSTGFGFGAKL